LQVENNNLPEALDKITVKNMQNIVYYKDKLAIAYLRVKDWLAVGGGEWINIVCDISTSQCNYLEKNLTAGKPWVLNITVYNDSEPAENITVCASEYNGFPPFILPQNIESNVSNEAIGCVETNSMGNLKFTIVPTGGVGVNNLYDIAIRLYKNNAHILTINYNCGDQCNFPEVSGSAQDIVNKDNIRYFKDKIAIVYLRIKDWLKT
ncbi:MAG: hypothetical protein QXQ79_02240, partial [Candidatus Nanoarchaeia archaeon]